VKATSHPQIDNARVVVTGWRFAPGAQTGHHVHAHDYEFRFVEIEIK
jgi:quercetin dioxygenase-like cupin family protein